MTPDKLLPALTACVLATSLLTACQAGQGGAGTFTAAPQTVAPQAAAAFVAIPYDEMPEIARRISAAIDGHIASQPATQVAGIAFSSQAGQSNILPWLQSEGFVLTGSSLYRHHDVGAAGVSQSAGRLDYTDSLGRSAGFLWAADHRVTGTTRTIEQLEIAPAFEPRPRVHLALIPTAALPGGAFPSVSTYADLAQVLSQYALSPDEVPPSQAEYFIVLSSLDPISSTAKLDLLVSSKAAGADGYDAGAARTLISNWGLTVLRGTLDLARHPDLYAKAVFTPGREMGQPRRTATLVGVFSLKPRLPGS